MTSRTVRNLLEVASVAALIVAGYFTFAALYGADAVQIVKPMTRTRLVEIPAFMLIVYVSLLLLARCSHLLKLPVEVTVENSGRLQILVKSMVGWLKAEALVMFAWLQIIQIQVARETRSSIPVMAFQMFTVLIFATSLIHYVAIRRQAPK